MLFCAGHSYKTYNSTDNTFVVGVKEEVETTNGWVRASDLHVGDVVVSNDEREAVKQICIDGEKVNIVF